LNNTGSFVMKAERVGDETVLAQIVRMVSEAQRSPRADPAPRRQGLGLFRAGGFARGGGDVSAVWIWVGRSRASLMRL